MLHLLALLSPAALAGSLAAPGTIGGPDASAAKPNVAALHYNPAAIAAAPGVQVLADVQVAAVRVDATTTRNDGIDPNTGEPYNVAQARVKVPVAIIGATWQVIPDRLTVGFGVADVFVGGGNYMAGEPDEEAPYVSWQRYAAVKTSVITIHLIPAVGVTVVDGVHVGGSFKYILDTFEAIQAADPLGTEGMGPDGAYTSDTVLQGDLSGSHIGWAGGVFVDRFQYAQVGVSYTNNGVFHAEGDGSVLAPAWLTTAQQITEVPAKLTFDAPLPPVIQAFVRSQVNDKLEVGAGAEIQLWGQCCGQHGTADGEEWVDDETSGAYKGGDIKIGVYDANDADDNDTIGPDEGLLITVASTQYSPRRLENSINFAANVGYQATEAIWVGGRLAYNQNAVPDYAVSATNIDYESVGATLAGRYTVGKVELGLTYGKFFPFERAITNSAWDVRDDTDPDYVDEFFSPVTPYKAGTNGTYKAKVDLVGVRVGAKF